MHGCAFAAVKQAELDAGGVNGFGHFAAERIDFAGHLPLGNASDGRIARHASNGREIGGDEKALKPASSNSQRSFTAGVASADNYNIVHE